MIYSVEDTCKTNKIDGDLKIRGEKENGDVNHRSNPCNTHIFKFTEHIFKAIKGDDVTQIIEGLLTRKPHQRGNTITISIINSQTFFFTLHTLQVIQGIIICMYGDVICRCSE